MAFGDASVKVIKSSKAANRDSSVGGEAGRMSGGRNVIKEER